METICHSCGRPISFSEQIENGGDCDNCISKEYEVFISEEYEDMLHEYFQGESDKYEAEDHW